MPTTFRTSLLPRAMWHSRQITKPAPKICMPPTSSGVRTMQKIPCPQGASPTISARTQSATIWSRSTICTSVVGSGAGAIWASMFCSRLWSCNEVKTICSCVHAFNGGCFMERRNARTQKSKFLFILLAQTVLKIGAPQSRVVQTVKNTTAGRTQIIIQ